MVNDRVFTRFLNMIFPDNKDFPIRSAIVKILFYNKHLSVKMIKEIYEKQEKNSVNISTIYQIINLLEEKNLIKSINLKNVIYYELENGLRHDHLVCIKCGKIVEFIDESFSSLEQNLGKIYEFNVDGRILILQGVCKKCQLS
ncbi:transcriptional repressor [Campylobacter ureolyticus]|uniref:Fur family transcriptional regulator n=1 Tax=Campylobacter ureolyticus TaxID=827 RepID=UPI0022B3946D|nr:transcriptional repressor [Campylobacter ureolyticus]MCZ6132879.1 transcriptional repressor [Campylobacter ureolyticus]